MDCPTRAENVPAGQLVQVAGAVAPVAVEYRPVPQSKQLLAEGNPEPVPYVPAAQLMQIATAVAPAVVE